MKHRNALNWLHPPGGRQPKQQGLRETRAHRLMMRLALAAALVLSPVLFLPLYMAVGTAGPASALLSMLIVNIVLIGLCLRWLVGHWDRRDRKIAAEERQRMDDVATAQHANQAKHEGPWQR